MVTAIINIDEQTNWILNIIKAKFNLNDKSQAIEMMAKQYEEEILEPELRPEYVEKLKNIEKKSKFKAYTSIAALRKELENA